MNSSEMNEKIANFLHLKFKILGLDTVYGVWVTDDASENIIYSKSFNKEYYTIPYDSDWTQLMEVLKLVKNEIDSIMQSNIDTCMKYNRKHKLDIADDEYNDEYILQNAKFEAVKYPIDRSLESLDKLEMHKAVYDAIVLLTS